MTGSDIDIVDPHHHLWSNDAARTNVLTNYMLDELLEDTNSAASTGTVSRTVFIECRSGYRSDGPEHMRVVGETEFVAAVAAESAKAEGATISAIVAHADLTMPTDVLDEVLDAHVAAGQGLFRGIRDALAHPPPGLSLYIPGRSAEGKSADPDFRRGVAHLGERGFTYDTWHYFVQNREFGELAAAVPGTTMILDHFGTPLGVGDYAGRHDEVFDQWKGDYAFAASRPNVVAKLGGMAMPDNGFGWHEDPANRPDVKTFVRAQERWYHHAIDCFGPDRCMFESNFPVDKLSVDYSVYWEAMTEIASRYTSAEREAMFSGTASRVYGI